MVIVIGSLLLFGGLALLMLRRRNEVLQNFLTPEEPDIEEDFFRVRRKPQEKEAPEEEPYETAKAPVENADQWGDGNQR